MDQASRHVNNKYFKDTNRLDSDLYETTMYKKKITWNLPFTIGFFVYCAAKLRMLEFQYDFLQRYVSTAYYEPCYMDTDSMYMALTDWLLDVLVPEALRLDYFTNLHKWFPLPVCAEHRKTFIHTKLANQPWLPASCCRDQAAYDKRTPGLFKEEWSGEGIIALCSKTYYAISSRGDKNSTKGINKRQNNLTVDTFRNVLETAKAGYGINKGFRVIDNKMITYAQTRNALSYLYCKRIIQSDGITTTPIEL